MKTNSNLFVNISSLKSLFLFLLLTLPFLLLSQSAIHSKVIDKESKESIAFCNVYNQSLKTGSISNIDGDFKISVGSNSDTLVFSYVGYQGRKIVASKLLSWESVSLESTEHLLDEIEVIGDNDYLYDILSDCRKVLKKSKRIQESKAYFSLNTSIEEQPLEFLECYYNAEQRGGDLIDLYLKNGRLALKAVDGGLFLNHNTTQAFSKIHLTSKSDLMPNIILQYSKRMMKKKFEVSLDFCDNELYKISFHPKDSSNTAFQGEIWINKKSSFIRKISLEIVKTEQHPFVNNGLERIKDINCSITKVFQKNDTTIILDHTLFDLRINEMNYNGKTKAGISPFFGKQVEISSVLYFYDYKKPFILPYFEYDNSYRDYRKLSIIPYNEAFWNGKKLLLSNHQKKQLGVLKTDGILINFDKNHFGNGFMKQIYTGSPAFNNRNYWYEHQPYFFWSKKYRMTLNKHLIDKQEPESDEFFEHRMIRDLYDFKVQILLDINPVDSIFNCKAFTVFDLTKTFYKTDENENSNAFINIYFDICEIEKQRMEKKLIDNNQNIEVINAIYEETLNKMDSITNQYLIDVKLGKDKKELKEWNAYVLENLGIDNIKMFMQAE